MGGPENDQLLGGAGDDRLASVDGFGESIDGDNILDKDAKGNDFATVDDEDSVVYVETKSVEVHGVGKLRLENSLHAVAGKPARVSIAWRHPKAWKALRSLEWRLMDGVDQIGTVKIRPRSGRLAATGAVKLAGAPLTVDVAATDAKNHRQIEAAAALIDVIA
jgi:hypothetical protein